MAQQYQTLRLVLGDQLHQNHSWFSSVDDTTCYVMMEVWSETVYVRHHIQKVVGFFMAMRQFAATLQELGHHVLYLKLDDEDNEQTFGENIKKLVARHNIQRFEYQLPDEYRVDEHLKQLGAALTIPCQAVDSEHFLVERDFVATLFKGKKRFLLETFYRKIRLRHQLLMEADGETPLTGQWNYDQSNRKKYPAQLSIPPHLPFLQDAREVVAMLERLKVPTFGNITPDAFDCPLTRKEALELLEHFNRLRLSHFGDYQDALSERHWLGFHSRLSFVLNVKLITPLEVVEAAIEYWKTHQNTIDIAQVEGFVRQIVGWREYVRGIYWAKMPEYATKNYFDHQAPLPDFYWTGNTKMKCVGHAVQQSLDRSYAHHIQRLMITGNFALLLGVHPDEIDAWYLGVYMDALEWVEITNTRGMSQYADGGIVGTKPYVSSANYIDKMSDYCQNCYYDKKQKYGSRACPFNSLYWDFYDRNGSKLKNIPRINMMLATWHKMAADEQVKILEQAAFYKKNAK
ncbi:MAG: cryptochrome/photolyase family protein [Saprospiraceae bacterium]|nr:cryptochrome/photolyase family protein [Saprospiraceae bacterium]